MDIDLIHKELEKKDWKIEELGQFDYALIADVAEVVEKQLTIPRVVQATPEKVCELIRQKFDDWVFGLETQAGEKLKVVDSTDFNEIITEIERELKDL